MKVFFTVLGLLLLLSSCFTFKQDIGKGLVTLKPIRKDSTVAATKVVSVSKKRWYLLWGLSPLNTVDAKKMAKGAVNYTVKQRLSVLDMLIGLPTGFFLSSQTVTVKKLAFKGQPKQRGSPTSK